MKIARTFKEGVGRAVAGSRTVIPLQPLVKTMVLGKLLPFNPCSSMVEQIYTSRLRRTSP